MRGKGRCWDCANYVPLPNRECLTSKLYQEEGKHLVICPTCGDPDSLYQNERHELLGDFFCLKCFRWCIPIATPQIV